MILGSATESSALAGSKSAEAGAKLQDDLNRFLNILVTQLQNQDPLDPLDANEFTSQLVQFASVEQQIYQNSNLEKMLNLQETRQISEMVDLIGSRVEFFGQKLPLENSAAKFSYVMPSGVVDATVSIANADGINVFSSEANTNPGKHTVEWDGKDKNNRQLPDGEYTVSVSGKDPEGKLVTIDHLMTGTVNGAGVDDGVVKLFVGGGVIIGQDKILSVHKPNTNALLNDIRRIYRPQAAPRQAGREILEKSDNGGSPEVDKNKAENDDSGGSPGVGKQSSGDTV